MSQFIRDFVEHPRSVGENYFQHLRSALGFSWRLAAAAFCCAAHALLPGLFKCTASAQIALLHDRMIVNRHRSDAHKNSDGSVDEGAELGPAPVSAHR